MYVPPPPGVVYDDEVSLFVGRVLGVRWSAVVRVSVVLVWQEVAGTQDLPLTSACDGD
jgi:hypothetical protein